MRRFGSHSLPNEATRCVWKVLAPLFNDDTGVRYALINEPWLPVSSANSAAWARSRMESRSRPVRRELITVEGTIV